MSPAELKDKISNPIETIARLDEYIIGQNQAKKVLAIMLMNRGLIKLSRAGLIGTTRPLQNSNVLLIGKTGVGKTGLIRALEEIADVPISIFDITSVTGGAYIGHKIEDMLVRHIDKCTDWVDSNYKRILEKNAPVYTSVSSDGVASTPAEDLWAKDEMLMDAIETGIIYIDEIDKICGDRELQGYSGSTGMVQNELLKILESTRNSHVSLFPARAQYPRCGIKTVDVSGISFVCGGAFNGLDDIITRRMSIQSGIGFHAEVDWKSTGYQDGGIFQFLTTEDLVEYGFKEEFLGRVPLRSVLETLSKETLIKIILYSKDSIWLQYVEMFNLFGVHLGIEDSALEEVALMAIELKTGARGLKYIFSNILTDELTQLFNYTDSRFIITRDLVKARGTGER
jgi:ATP-dependent Clp protease ATP-binding subunit ClpX